MEKEQKIEGFNRMVVVGPSRSPEFKSDIDIDRYGDWAASIFHGYLNPKMKSPQVYIIGGVMDSLEGDKTWTVESTQRISERLQSVYGAQSSTIVVNKPKAAGFEERISNGISRCSRVFKTAVNGERQLGLVVDRQHREIGSAVLSELNIHCRVFELRPPIYAGVRIPENASETLIDFSEYTCADSFEELAETGDV